MISSVKNVQILVSLLKQHNIKDIVISPGSRDFQLVHSVETDSFFRTYTVVDERSAAFLLMDFLWRLISPCVYVVLLQLPLQIIWRQLKMLC